MKILIAQIVFMASAVPINAQSQQRATSTSDAQRLVRDNLTDPSSARFRNVQQKPNGAVCGEVNAKNRMGGYVGFAPFAVDRSLSVVNVHSSKNHATDDHYDTQFNIRAVCERRRDESLRDSRQRIADELVASVDVSTQNWCRNNPSSSQCSPQYMAFSRESTRRSIMSYVHE